MPQNATTNQLLGYPPDARLLILNNDDFGMCHAINEGIVQTMRAGAATSCTLMMPCPWALHAVKLLQDNPDLSFGVHLTAVSEPPYYRWRPLTPAQNVPSLVDEAGYFYHETRIPEFLAQVELAELELEFRAQIEAVLAQGLQPTHLDSHCLISTRREDIFDMSVQLALDYGLAMRVTPAPFIAKLQQQGFATHDYELLDSYRLESQDKLATYLKLLRQLPAGLSEWAIHPALTTPELQAISDSWPVRQADYEFLMSPQTQQVLQQEGIIVLDYQPLQTLWQTKKPS